MNLVFIGRDVENVLDAHDRHHKAILGGEILALELDTFEQPAAMFRVGELDEVIAKHELEQLDFERLLEQLFVRLHRRLGLGRCAISRAHRRERAFVFAQLALAPALERRCMGVAGSFVNPPFDDGKESRFVLAREEVCHRQEQHADKAKREGGQTGNERK